MSSTSGVMWHQDGGTGGSLLTLSKRLRASQHVLCSSECVVSCVPGQRLQSFEVFCKSVLSFLRHVTVGWVSMLCAAVWFLWWTGYARAYFQLTVSDPSLFWWAGATELGLATPLLFNLFLPALWSLNIELELSRYLLLWFQSLPISSPAAFLTQTVCLDDTTVKFEIWDTAGQERYHSLAPMYYRGAQAAIVVYDITNTVRYIWHQQQSVTA